MISLPAGVTINRNARIVVWAITPEMIEWWQEVGGTARVESWYDAKGREQQTTVLQFGHAKPSYKMQSGTGEVILNFNQEDSNTALMFIIKFIDDINTHNLREYTDYVY